MLESFRSYAEANAHFEPEREACAEIVSVFDRQGIGADSLRAAVAILNRVSEAGHPSSSIWFDLQNQIAVSCCEHGVGARVRPGGSHSADLGIAFD